MTQPLELDKADSLLFMREDIEYYFKRIQKPLTTPAWQALIEFTKDIVNLDKPEEFGMNEAICAKIVQFLTIVVGKEYEKYVSDMADLIEGDL